MSDHAFRCLIAVEGLTETANEFGGVIETWETVRTVRAWLVEQSTVEADEAAGVASSASRTFRLRPVPGLSTANRIAHADRTFDIVELIDLGRRCGIEIRCTARAAS